jgi:ribose transport system substrate-binding protein
MVRHGFALSIVLSLVGLMGCGGDDNRKATQKSGDQVIAVIPKGLTHSHWHGVRAGAEKAAEETGYVEILWKGPPKEDDTTQQIQTVQNMVSKQVDGIILAPLSDQALISPVRMAARSGIPVVIIDSPLAGDLGRDYVAYVGTDNKAAGKLAGKYMAEILEGQGTVMMLRYAESSASTNEREAGFVEALKAQGPDIRLIDPPQYAGADDASAKKNAENMLTTYEGQFDGVFCPNESSTYGMMVALKDRKLAGKVKFVGFDIRADFLEFMDKGYLHGFVIQNPFEMGYQSVKVMLDHMAGKAVETEIDTGAILVTPENVDMPRIAEQLDQLTKDGNE